MPTNKIGLFVFRRDLRIHDNLGLINLCKICDTVYCLFILDSRQIKLKSNPYFSYNSFLFMLQSLQDLKQVIPLTILDGLPHAVISEFISKHKVTHVSFNADYTPFSIKRDNEIKQAIDKSSIRLAPIQKIQLIINNDDLCLNSPTSIKPYKVFTPYYNFAKQHAVLHPNHLTSSLLKKIKKAKSKTVILSSLIDNVKRAIGKTTTDIKLLLPGGRTSGLKLLNKFANTNCKSYKNRDMLMFETSRLGPHLKFGTVSVREVYSKCTNQIFRKQLYWRDFYLQIGYHFPRVFGSNFKNKIKWSNSKTLFAKWCKGETGFEIVDACMTQLNKSGFMHNRGRMIVASFLTKLLHIDWRWGEKYFAQKLTDYDPCNNNGGWQWSAGTGVDAQPYFRIFNPYMQQKKFDPDKQYIKKWLGNRAPIKEIINYEAERKKALHLYN